MPLDDTDVSRVLVVTAHPDDVDFGAAGTVARWTDAGLAVTYCICTDGQAGGFDPDVPREHIPEIRRAEQRAAAAEVGVDDVRFLGYEDGELEPSRALVRDLVRLIRQVRPERLLTHSPERWWDRLPASHPDHMAAGEAAVRALYPFARNPFAFPELLEHEGLEDWVVQELWLIGAPGPNHWVDVTDTFQRKVRGILRHESQTPDRARFEPMVREWLTGNAERGGLPQGRLAEAFRVHATA
ncbi:MAG TPA: PIG-L deacetylase family protein [Jiangellales bacterium]|nr:PIG-L deacetylase family protein [Jiangellales bacterium]